MGGIQAPLEVDLKDFGPWNAGMFDFQRSCVQGWLRVFSGSWILASGLISVGAWQTKARRRMVGLGVETAWNYAETKYMKKVGDLGIEPRSQYLQAKRTNHWTTQASLLL